MGVQSPMFLANSISVSLCTPSINIGGWSAKLRTLRKPKSQYLLY